MELKDKRVLVTGATGFIGSHVTQRLLKEGAKVRVLVRKLRDASLFDGKSEVIQGDMTDGLSLQRAVQRCQIVFHFAGALGNECHSWDYFRKVNVEGTRRLARAAARSGVERFIHASTSWVYGLDAGKGVSEISKHVISNDPYCDTKLEAEDVIREMSKEGLHAVIIQPTIVYGPGDETWTMTPIRLLKRHMLFLPDGGKGLMQPIFIDDLVEGIMLALHRGKVGDSYILCNAEIVTAREFFEHLAGLIGRSKIPSMPWQVVLACAKFFEFISTHTGFPAPFTATGVRGVTMHATYDCRKAQQELGFSPKVTLTEGMQKVTEWLSGKLIT